MNSQANMMGVNSAGGPVGAAPMMNNSQGGPRGPRQADQSDPGKNLNTYIYDYLLKTHHYEVARVFQKELEINIAEKPSPGRRPNGIDSMDTDSKDDIHKKPADLPEPALPPLNADSNFLFDWWCQFWDIWAAHRGKGNNPNATHYLNHTIQQSRMRRDMDARSMRGADPTMMLNYQNAMRLQQTNGRPLQQQAMANNRNMTPQQQLQMQKAMMANQMQRDGSIDQRPNSPGSGDNAPSPSKRPRTEGAFNGQMGPAGRGQGMPNQMGSMPGGPNGQMMLPDGMNGMPQQPQMNAFGGSTPGVQNKSLEVYSQNLLAQQQNQGLNNLPKGMNPGVQGSPMVQQGADGAFMEQGGRGALVPPGQQPATGNHALQDYQMQLMLLEQQNKKRLLMARQEQDNISQVPQGSAPMGQSGFPQAMSPSGNRSGPSPNPADQMKRGTPKMGQVGVPGSPMPDAIQNRGSPAPNFDPNQIAPNMPSQFYAQMGAGPNGMMRPPSSHPGFNMGAMQNMNPQQLESFRQQNGGRMPNGWPQPGPPHMMQQPGQQQGQQPPQMGTPRQPQNAMPPPPAPQAGEPARTQPSSPATQPAPPTPNQGNKANPKKKGEGKEPANRKKTAKKAAGATPAAEPDQPPPTPTASTPITPMHNQTFGNQKNGTGPQNQPPAAAAQPAAPPPMDPVAQPFGALDNENFGTLDFTMDGDNVLENFDFDSFLHTDDGTNGFTFDSSLGFPDGVEATGDIN